MKLPARETGIFTPSPTARKRFAFRFGLPLAWERWGRRPSSNTTADVTRDASVFIYTGINGLDLTLGQAEKVPVTLLSAFGRELDHATTNDCFNCHATAAVQDGKVQPDKLLPGITCEDCHGAGEKHVRLMRARSEERKLAQGRDSVSVSTATEIFNPGRFDTEGITQFCGSCHRSWIQVQMMAIRGIENVRFQPYRIFKSKCYDSKDRRISCLACHDSHDELAADPSFYDARCTACHRVKETAARPEQQEKACPKSANNCTTCHMPKTELPGAHHQFADHWIRIVRPGEKYPD